MALWMIGDHISMKLGDVLRAFQERDETAVEALVKRQCEADVGGLLLDLGAERGDELVEAVRWLVLTAQQWEEVPLAVRTSNIQLMRAAALTAQGSFMVDATSPAMEDWRPFLELAMEREAYLVLPACPGALPTDVTTRVRLVTEELMPQVFEAGLPDEYLFIDPFLTAISCDQPWLPTAVETLLLLRQAIEDRVPPRTIVHLADVSDGTAAEVAGLLNRTYLAMLMAAGLDAAFADPTDAQLRSFVRMVEQDDASTPLGKLLLHLKLAVVREQALSPEQVNMDDPEQAAIYKTVRVLRNEVIYADNYLEV